MCNDNIKKENISYRNIEKNELNISLFDFFLRRQIVNKCYRKRNDTWVIEEDPFIDDWSLDDLNTLVKELNETLNSCGFVFGAFINNKLKGFTSCNKELIGKNKSYCDLTNIYVSEDVRNKGIGTTLFNEAIKFAKNNGAKKLYISAHSSFESQSFYRKLGCVEAKEYNKLHVQKEPFDCQLEFVIYKN